MEKVFNLKLKKMIDNHKIISFDIFDTLIKRNCYQPIDIYEIVEENYNKNNLKKIENFSAKRIVAEKKARENNKHLNEVTLDLIYNELEYPVEIKKKLMKLEINTEIDLCQFNSNILEVLDYCKKNNKRIICISDMYLDLKIIEKIISKINYSFEKIYVSSKINMTKISGDLFEFVLSDLNISKNELLHIGDSWKADFISPIKKGIAAFHIKKRISNLTYINPKKINDCTSNIIYSYINNNICKNDDNYYRIGYEIVGPMCLDFVYWLENETKLNSINNLLFCARDMQMIQEIYNKYFGDECDNSYFYVSRKSTYLPYLYKNSNYDNFCKLIPVGRRKFKISEILDLYNIKMEEDEFVDALNRNNLSSDKLYDASELKKSTDFRNFYNSEIIKQINSTGRKQYNNFIKYINKLKFNSNTAIVDLGWRGTTQSIIMDITNSNVHGFYFGLHSLNGENLMNNFNTYLFFKEENGYSEKVYAFMSLCELLLSALHGSTISYTSDLNKPYILNEGANKDNKEIQKIQQGATDFCNEIRTLKKYLHFNGDKKYVDLFINLGINPSYELAKCLGNIYTENVKTRKLCSYKKTIYYLFHIKKLKNDFIDSEWKIGFMKRLFKLKLPYYQIYSFLKKFK